MISSLFWKIVGNQVSQATSSSSSSAGAALAIAIIVVLALALLGLIIWFYCACYGWLVLVYPAFAAFPRWAFVLLIFILGNKSSSSSSSKSS